VINKSIFVWLVAGYLLAITLDLQAHDKIAQAEEQADVISSEVIIPGIVGNTFTDDLPSIRQRGILRALVSFSRTDFFLQGARPRGLFVELLHQYENFLNKGRKRNTPKISIKYVPVTFDRLIPALLAGEGDIAVGHLTVTPARQRHIDFARDERVKVDELLVMHKRVAGIQSLEDLSGRTVYVKRASSYAEHLRGLNAHFASVGRQPIDIRPADPHLVTEDLIELVNAGVIELTVADDFRARLWEKVLENIVVRDDVKINEGGRLGWGVRKENSELLQNLRAFAKTVQGGTRLGNILFRRYYENTRWIKNPLAENEREKLAQLSDLFVKYGRQYDFDWLAVLAQAYQESGLDHSVVSPAGAVGIMQLLPTTAADPNVGIADIRDLEQNIHAGTKYLAFLRDRYYSGSEFDDENRFAFSWAAYNAGPARVRSIRRRAEQMGLDPMRWFGNVEYAALAIVGRETYRYVRNIFKYYITYKIIGDIGEERLHRFKELQSDR